MPIARRIPLVQTSLGTLLSRSVNLLGLPRGTRLGVIFGNRRVRSDKRFSRKRLPKAFLSTAGETVKQAAEALILPRLPKELDGARVVAFPPGERSPAPSNTLLRTARKWGDGLTEAEGEIFDAKVDVTEEELISVYIGIEGNAAVSKEILLAATCRFFDNANQMHDFIRQRPF
ncbi:hypothetical protein [Methylobacterium sp. yr668]|uniref:hypothetical protein n=1 Tax=Methylobacterium sp. yr668 TaxID=1761801 RepID=UPI0008F3EC9B|nr:hypothetical protein [Methylobacterium sp. yr668]SFT30431.1 hypothetical protein SAMN04487845_1757 [Methylobacterium sp. yr668]